MSHDNHNDNGHSENKPVAFTAPLILGCVAVFIILLFVSLGNPCHGKCCDEKCEKECTEKCEKGGVDGKHDGNHDEKHGKEQESVSMPASEEHATQEDSTKTVTEPVKEEAHH